MKYYGLDLNIVKRMHNMDQNFPTLISEGQWDTSF